MSQWIKLTFHVSPTDIRTDHARRLLAIGEPVAFDDEVFYVTAIRDDGSYDVAPHPRAEEFMAAMLDHTVSPGEAMRRAWEIGKVAIK